MRRCSLILPFFLSLGCSAAGPSAPSAERAQETGEEPVLRRDTTRFGIRRLVGRPGKGIEYFGMEASYEEPIPRGVRRTTLLVEDRLAGASGRLRSRRVRTTIDVTGDLTRYRSEHGDGRLVVFTLEGKQVRHFNRDPTGRNPRARGLPREMEDPVLLDEGLIGSYQRLFDRFRERHEHDDDDGERAKHALDGLELRAIAPLKLAVIEVSIREIARETLDLSGGKTATTQLEVRSRLERDPRGARAPAFTRRFWLDERGIIVKAETPQQKAHGAAVAYDLGRHSAWGGAFTRVFEAESTSGQAVVGNYTSGDIEAPKPWPGSRERPSLVLVLHPVEEDSKPMRGLVHRARWQLGAAGFRVLSVEVSGSPGETDAIISLMSHLPSQSLSDLEDVLLISTGATLGPAIGLQRSLPCRGWILLEPLLQAGSRISKSRARYSRAKNRTCCSCDSPCRRNRHRSWSRKRSAHLVSCGPF